MTKAREAVLAAVDASAGPVAAADLRERLGGDMDLATVYRALSWLEGHSLVDAFPFACSERGVERYYVSKKGPHGHFFHCEGCHRFIPVRGCGAEGIVAELEERYGFVVTGHTLYFTGYCAECAALRRGGPAAAD